MDIDQLLAQLLGWVKPRRVAAHKRHGPVFAFLAVPQQQKHIVFDCLA